MKTLSLNICYMEHKQGKTKSINKKLTLFAVAYIEDGRLCLHIQNRKMSVVRG